MNMLRMKMNPLSILLFLVMLVVTIFLILPMVWLLSASFQGSGQIFLVPFHWIPKTFEWDNYSRAWLSANLKNAFITSISVSFLTMIVHVTLNTALGYIFIKYKFPFKKLLVGIFLLTLMFPQLLTFFTVYRYAKWMGLIDSRLGLALPYLVGGFAVFLMMQFAKYIPNEILESAKIDGSGNMRTFVSIAVPMMKAGITALAILDFTFMWNEYPWAHLVINTASHQNLPLALVYISQKSDNSTDYPGLMAGCIISFLPVLAIYLVFQRQFIESIGSGAVKG